MSVVVWVIILPFFDKILCLSVSCLHSIQIPWCYTLYLPNANQFKWNFINSQFVILHQPYDGAQSPLLTLFPQIFENIGCAHTPPCGSFGGLFSTFGVRYGRNTCARVFLSLVVTTKQRSWASLGLPEFRNMCEITCFLAQDVTRLWLRKHCYIIH